MYQMKKEERITVWELNKTQIIFKVLVMKIIHWTWQKSGGPQWDPNKKKTKKMKNSSEIKNTLDGINRLEEAEEWMSNLEKRVMESNQAEQERKNNNKWK